MSDFHGSNTTCQLAAAPSALILKAHTCVQVLGDPGARKLESECQRHLGCGWGTYFGESILLLARLQLEQRYLKMLPQVLSSTRPMTCLLLPIRVALARALACSIVRLCCKPSSIGDARFCAI